MKKKKIIIISASVVGVAIAYLIYKKLRKKSKNRVSVTTSTNTSEDVNQPVDTSYTLYIVSTKNTNLNVRQSPSISSAVVDSLEKGSSVYAKQSSDGWMDVSKDGITSIGYASSKYLTKQ